MAKDNEIIAQVEQALKQVGVKSWLIFGYVPPHTLIYSRGEEDLEMLVKVILKSLIEDESLREMFKSMLKEIDRGLTTKSMN
jgi:hypothetical protein